MYSRRRGAFLATLVLIFQSLVATTLAEAANPQQLDAFGNPLCISSSASGTPGADHVKASICCSTACHLASCDETGGKQVASVAGALETQLHRPGRISFNGATPMRRYVPGRPRAPPAMS